MSKKRHLTPESQVEDHWYKHRFGRFGEFLLFLFANKQKVLYGIPGR